MLTMISKIGSFGPLASVVVQIFDVGTKQKHECSSLVLLYRQGPLDKD